MNKITRVFFVVAILTSQMYVSFADRGIGRKKSKVILNIKAPANFASSLDFNLHNGMRYTGSLIPAASSVRGTQTTLITYQKGNSIYILPYKQKIFVADMRQGYTGTKLIIRVP